MIKFHSASHELILLSMFNIYKGGVVREVDARILGRNLSVLQADDRVKLNQQLFANDTTLVADSEGEIVSVGGRVWTSVQEEDIVSERE